jgi:hypothetical protein
MENVAHNACVAGAPTSVVWQKSLAETFQICQALDYSGS